MEVGLMIVQTYSAQTSCSVYQGLRKIAFHSFIHFKHLYSASSSGATQRGAPNHNTTKQNRLKLRKECLRKISRECADRQREAIPN